MSNGSIRLKTRQLNDQPLLAQGLNLCGNASRHQGHFEEGQAYYEQSLALHRAIGDRRGYELEQSPVWLLLPENPN